MTDLELIFDGGDEIPPPFEPVTEILTDQIVCDICAKVCKNERGLKLHLAKAHGTGSDSTPHKAARKGSLARELSTSIQDLALLVSLADQFDGLVLASNADRLANAWANLAAKNKTVDKILRGATGSMVYGEVIVATAMVILPICAHHGLLPESIGLLAGQVVASAAAPLLPDADTLASVINMANGFAN